MSLLYELKTHRGLTTKGIEKYVRNVEKHGCVALQREIVWYKHIGVRKASRIAMNLTKKKQRKFVRWLNRKKRRAIEVDIKISYLELGIK